MTYKSAILPHNRIKALGKLEVERETWIPKLMSLALEYKDKYIFRERYIKQAAATVLINKFGISTAILKDLLVKVKQNPTGILYELRNGEYEYQEFQEYILLSLLSSLERGNIPFSKLTNQNWKDLAVVAIQTGNTDKLEQCVRRYPYIRGYVDLVLSAYGTVLPAFSWEKR